jgi:hypothetical protein
MPEFATSGPVTVDARLAAGSLDLQAEPRQSAQVEITPYDDSDTAHEAAARTRVELTGDTLLIVAPETGGWLLRRSPKLRVTVRVPTGSAARLRVANADTACHGEWSQFRLNTASGDAYVEHTTGDLTVNSASGNVRTGRIGGRLTVKTASGDVSAQEVAGSVDVKSASGDVQVDLAGADLAVATASGDATVGAARRGTLRTNTVSGDVSVGVVTGTAVWLDLNTISGRTHSDLNVGEPAGKVADHELTVLVRTVSGSIDVHRTNQPAQSPGQT